MIGGIWKGIKSIAKQPAIQGLAMAGVAGMAGAPGVAAMSLGAAVGLANQYLDVRGHESDNAVQSLEEEVRVLEQHNKIAKNEVEILKRKAMIALITLIDAHEQRNTLVLFAHLIVGCIFSLIGYCVWANDIHLPPDNIPWHAAFASASKNLVHAITPLMLFSLSMIIICRVRWFSENSQLSTPALVRIFTGSNTPLFLSNQKPSSGARVEEIFDDSNTRAIEYSK